MLQVSPSSVKLLPLGDSNTAKKGETVFVAGNPKGLEGTLSDGILGAIRKDFHIELLQITAPISPGSSGGPVLNGRGEIIGVATFGFKADDAQNLNFAIPSNSLRSLLKRHRIPLPPKLKRKADNSGTKQKNEEIAKAEIEKAKADAEKAKAEAERAKADAEKAKAEAKKAEAEAKKAEAERAKAEAESDKTEKAKAVKPRAHITGQLKAATVHIIGKRSEWSGIRVGERFFCRTGSNCYRLSRR